MLGRLFKGALLLFLFTTAAFSSFVLENDEILTTKAIEKIDEISNELKSKTGISAYVIAKKDLDGKKIREYSENITKNLNGNFALFIFALNEKKVNIYSNIDSKFDKDDILDNYVIPILVSKDKQIQKYPAAVFNGFAELSEQIAQSFNVELSSSIGSEGKNAYDIVVYIIYFMIATFFATFIYIFLRRDK